MGARELLVELAHEGFIVAADGDRLVIRPASKLSDIRRAELLAAKPELLELLRGDDRLYRLTKAEADAAHAEPWTDAACGRFVALVSLFLRRGVNATDADDLAERSHLRGVQGDDRSLCLECAHLARRASTGWRCGNHRVAGMGRELVPDLLTQPQRCPGFVEGA